MGESNQCDKREREREIHKRMNDDNNSKKRNNNKDCMRSSAKEIKISILDDEFGGDNRPTD